MHMPKHPETRLPKPAPTRGGAGTGVRYEMRLYIYEDGHGNINGRDSDGNFNVPVDSGDEAAEMLAKIWRRGRLAARRHATTRRRAAK
jgi:hypothetical protein